MEFKKMLLKFIVPVLLPGLLLMGLLFWRFYSKTEPSQTQPVQDSAGQEATQNSVVIPPITSPPTPGISEEEETAIQEQLDRDRKQQKQTKDLKIKLEQTNLELEQEKALSEINKLKKENAGAFNEPVIDGQRNIPEIKVDYIGGNNKSKEAILSIGNVRYQVKEKSNPVDNIQVVSISDTGVTLHLNTPEELTKTIEYKPE